MHLLCFHRMQMDIQDNTTRYSKNCTVSLSKLNTGYNHIRCYFGIYLTPIIIFARFILKITVVNLYLARKLFVFITIFYTYILFLYIKYYFIKRIGIYKSPKNSYTGVWKGFPFPVLRRCSGFCNKYDMAESSKEPRVP